MVKEDPKMQNLSKEEEDAFMNDLIDYRELNKKGARINNQAAAADARVTLDRFNTEVRSLAFVETR